MASNRDSSQFDIMTDAKLNPKMRLGTIANAMVTVTHIIKRPSVSLKKTRRERDLPTQLSINTGNLSVQTWLVGNYLGCPEPTIFFPWDKELLYSFVHSYHWVIAISPIAERCGLPTSPTAGSMLVELPDANIRG